MYALLFGSCKSRRLRAGSALAEEEDRKGDANSRSGLFEHFLFAILGVNRDFGVGECWLAVEKVGKV